MLRIADSLKKIVSANPLLLFGLNHRLLNLTQTARFIKPLIEARTKKSVQPSALLMALSRLQRELSRKTAPANPYRIEHLAIRGNLSTFTYGRSNKLQTGILRLHEVCEKEGGYLNVSQSTSQVTIIVESRFERIVSKLIGIPAQYSHTDISALSITFNERYADIPGFLATVLQQVALQGINVIEVASTFTELVLYIGREDGPLALETLYALFLQKG